jgi:catechol 2,3-dioxygenase-like lactoylglutathione lyase family enzyme
MRVLFVGSVGVITRSLPEGRRPFVDALGLPLEQAKGSEFLFTEKLEGSKYFGVWPLSEAARVCFGRDSWPSDRPVPQAFIEFEMGSPARVAKVASELESQGYTLLHTARTDPWGQTVTRLQTEDGIVVGVSHVPWMHRRAKPRSKRATSPRR